MGYDVAVDGIWGEKTKLAVDTVLGFDSYGINKLKLLALVRQKVQQMEAQKNICYRFVVVPEGKLPMEYELRADDLNKELEKYPCGVEEICVKLRDKLGGSVEFACKDSLGNNITLKLSTEKSSLDINLKSPDGGSSKLSFDTNGKIKLTASDGKMTRSVEHTL